MLKAIAILALVPGTAMAAGVGVTSTSNSNSGSSAYIGGTNVPDNTPAVSAPSFSTSNTCALGAGVGFAGPGFGFSAGGGKVDHQCELRKDTQMLMILAGKKTAIEHLCFNAGEDIKHTLRHQGLCDPPVQYSFCGIRAGRFTVEVKPGGDAVMAKQECMAQWYGDDHK